MVKNIDKIISEEINSYINKNIVQEDKASDISQSSSDDTSTKGTGQYSSYLEDLNDEGGLNLRKIVSRITGIPTSTKNKSNVNKLNAATSKIRKQIKREEAPGGGHYKLPKSTAADIAQELSTM